MSLVRVQLIIEDGGGTRQTVELSRENEWTVSAPKGDLAAVNVVAVKLLAVTYDDGQAEPA